MDTVLHLRPSQIGWRIWRRLGGDTPLNHHHRVSIGDSHLDVSRAFAIRELDFDPVFIDRFNPDSIADGKIELLHKERQIDWSAEAWRCQGETPLWRFNLHYCEYLLPLAKRYIDTGDVHFIEGAKHIINAWIDGNPRERGGAGWDSYTISMRVVNWLALYGECREALELDQSFLSTMHASLSLQYEYLSRHLEKDLRANHYLENLKALVLLACYFGDELTLKLSLSELEAQVVEQILPDGAHFELSPMYQKVVLEDLLRVCVCLRAMGKRSEVIESRIAPMCDFVYSLERGANRTPLFNDSGDNVAKSAASLLACAMDRAGIKPIYRSVFPNAGYYLLEGECGSNKVKVIFDAGPAGPNYACGHAHCDMLSIEVYVDGKPWIVNSGTYAYQDPSRLDWKRTSAHSTIQVESVEQSECWASFRVARMAEILKVKVDPNLLCATMRDCRGNTISRRIELHGDGVIIFDAGPNEKVLKQHWHFVSRPEVVGRAEVSVGAYSPEFGKLLPAFCVRATGKGHLDAVLVPEKGSIELVSCE